MEVNKQTEIIAWCPKCGAWVWIKETVVANTSQCPYDDIPFTILQENDVTEREDRIDRFLLDLINS